MKNHNFDILNGLDELYSECFSYIEIKADVNISARSNSISNINKSRLFSTPHAIYGHKYGPNKIVSWKLRKNSPADVFATDSQGILKNSLLDEDTEVRIKQAAKDGSSIIAFFGGSTMMSMGSVTPDFSIPALVERILLKKYNRKAVCVNFGLGGTCCREALQLYLNKIKLKDVQFNIVFYDGWNCASYLTHKQVIQNQNDESSSSCVTESDSMMSIRHNILLNKAYDLKWHLKSWINLFFAHLTEVAQNLIPRFLGDQLLRIQGRIFPLNQLENDTKRLLSKEIISDEVLNGASERAVDEYVGIHLLVKELVPSNKGYLWIQQPLVFWGNKPLTENERGWNENGYSSGDPRIFKFFDVNLKSRIVCFPDLVSDLTDMTHIFDDISEELYIDSGHLNRLGSLVVSANIANEIMSKQRVFGL